MPEKEVKEVIDQFTRNELVRLSTILDYHVRFCKEDRENQLKAHERMYYAQEDIKKRINWTQRWLIGVGFSLLAGVSSVAWKLFQAQYITLN